MKHLSNTNATINDDNVNITIAIIILPTCSNVQALGPRNSVASNFRATTGVVPSTWVATALDSSHPHPSRDAPDCAYSGLLLATRRRSVLPPMVQRLSMQDLLGQLPLHEHEMQELL